MSVPHFAFDFGFRSQRRDRVDDNDIDGARADQHVRDFECLLARIRLRDQEFVDFYA